MVTGSFRIALVCAALLTAGAAHGDPRYALAEPADAAALVRELDGSLLSIEAEAIRQALGADKAVERGRPALSEALEAAYEVGHFEPLWLGEEGPTGQMRAFRRRMEEADRDGLDPADYPLPAVRASYADDPAGLATDDVAFSRALALYVTHLASGRLDPQSVSRLITLTPERPDIADLLPRLARSPNVEVSLGDIEPPHPQYRALRKKLAELRAEAEEPGPVRIPEGKMLKPGAVDERIALLRTRLEVPLAEGADPLVMDEAVTEALRAFQEQAGLNPDGILGPMTLAALNGPDRQELIDAVVANMERWRWEPRDLGAFHISVNVPEFMVRVYKDGEPVHQTRVVVGTPRNPTPIFSHEMNHLVVNPYWNVPTSIVTNEMLPEIVADPYNYFARRGYQVLAQAGGKMRVVNPASIDWRYVNPRAVRIRQVPGDQNALGRIKFMFPNQHSVYLHDTPSKRLFQKDYRAYSHGCVRVEDPLGFADALLPFAAPEWSSARLQKLYGGPERRINLDRTIPIHLTYFTVSVEGDGSVSHFQDIYGFDSRFIAAIDKSRQS